MAQDEPAAKKQIVVIAVDASVHAERAFNCECEYILFLDTFRTGVR